MKKSNMHKKITIFIIFIWDILALALAFVISAILAQYISVQILDNHYMELISAESLERAKSFSVISAFVLFVFYNRGHYSRRIPWWSQIRYIIITLAIALLIDGFMHFATKHNFSRLWIVLCWFLSFVFIITGRQIAKFIASKLNLWKVPSIIIGDKRNIIESIFALYSESYTGYDVKTLVIHKGYKNFDKYELPIGYQNVEIIDGSKDYDELINKNKDSFYVLAPNSFDSFNFEKLVNKITDNNSRYSIVPPIEGIKLYGSTPQYFFGHDVMFLFSRDIIHSPLAIIVKRSMDILGSIIGLITLLPIFIILMLLIKKDGGPVFFGHERIGKNNKRFKCWKFRTMSVDAEAALENLLKNDKAAKQMWDTHRKLINDPRITKIGKLLRKTSIDEFPQLWNVLRGHMSLVGPRPILPDEVIFFNESELSKYKSVRPGITGLWQVSGRNNVSFKQRVHFDTWYVENWSLWCDIVVIIKTGFVLVNRLGAR
ncbi:MAG: undecaprenyl-phosphate galactose phosphotransferase WbaP [Proteobacteria bacterium]|nr:undecaprenyl-phosphate galactose phosphotransferase WbaP [Pseudomonadota bacterium]